MATIKAGTYRFNDVPTKISSVTEIDIPYEVSFSGYVFNCTKLFVTPTAHDDSAIDYYFVSVTPEIADFTPYFPFSEPVFSTVRSDFYGWNTASYGDSVRNITITSDTDVSSAFAEWFVANADPVADEPTEPETTNAATIVYNGSVIASLNGGQTATLKCAGLKMESDVVVAVPKQESAESVLQEKVITVTENGTIEITPDSGFDGLSKIVLTIICG